MQEIFTVSSFQVSGQRGPSASYKVLIDMAKAKQLLKSGRLIKTNTPLLRVRVIPRWSEKRHFDFTVTWKVLIAGWGLVFSDKRKSGVKMMIRVVVFTCSAVAAIYKCNNCGIFSIR